MENRRELEALFHEAANADATEIPGILERVGRESPGLARQLRALLDQDRRNDSLAPELRPSILDALGVTNPAVEETLGAQSSQYQTVDGYEILDVLGSGGMGVVFLARQLPPIERNVALKVIRSGSLSTHMLARFDIEREALATLNHDAIARVLDSGTTRQGQPFLTMELVEGMPLVGYCDSHRLDLEARIRLFQTVCAGVQHAHQKGVLHRDLKPGNILVATQGDRHVPKIVDFGLARLADADRSAEAHLTSEGDLLGTPEYMSPEQARGDTDAIDVRTDVFALGVILYELLTGVLPISSAELRAGSYAELRRILLESEPPKPSSRPPLLSEELAHRRATTRLGLARELRGDLDWIILRAMAKDPERRYGSAAALRRDLQRFLDHEPVEAGPAGVGYRARKLFRRYRLQSTAAALAAVAVVTGTAFSVHSAVTAGEQARLASDRRDEAMAKAKIADQRAVEIEQAKIELQKEGSALSERTEQFEAIGSQVQLERAVAAAEELLPPWPDKIEGMLRWQRDHAEPLAARMLTVEKVISALEHQLDPAEVETRRKAHPKYNQLVRAEARFRSIQRMQAISEGRESLVLPEPSREERAMTAAKLLNKITPWITLAPEDREWGKEAHALSLAQLAYEKFRASDSTAPAVTVLFDLGTALFINGRFTESKTKREEALDAASPGEKERYALYWREHDSLVLMYSGAGGAKLIAEIEATVRSLCENIEADAHRFKSPTQRVLYRALRQARRSYEKLKSDTVPSLAQRLAWARKLDHLSKQADHVKAWTAARAVIERADGLSASELYSAKHSSHHPIRLLPQAGLVPLGMNPRTKLWEFYHLRSAWDPASGQDPEDIPLPARDARGRIDVNGDTGIVFVLLPGREFSDGAHQVSLVPFFIARHELTQGQWMRLTGLANPSAVTGKRLSSMGLTPMRLALAHPVEFVAWTEGRPALLEHGLDLPTSMQWEYAARGGTRTPWWPGDDIRDLEGVENLADRTFKREFRGGEDVFAPFDDGFAVHAPVGRFRDNPFGLHDVHGNVGEWCRDMMVSRGFTPRPGDGLRHLAMPGTMAVRRGGTFMEQNFDLSKLGYLNYAMPTAQMRDVGLRPIRALIQE